MNDYELSFEERLGDELSRKGLSQVQFAEKIGVSQTSVHKWLNGMAYPKADSLKKICTVLGCSSDWLIGMPPSTRDLRTASRYTFLSVDAVKALSKWSRKISSRARDALIVSETLQLMSLLIERIRNNSLLLTRSFFELKTEELDTPLFQSALLDTKLAILRIKEDRTKIFQILAAFIEDYSHTSEIVDPIEEFIINYEEALDSEDDGR